VSLQRFVRCSRCGCLRPEGATRVVADGTVQHRPLRICEDTTWCSQQAGVGQGQLDADVGGPDAQPGDAA